MKPLLLVLIFCLAAPVLAGPDARVAVLVGSNVGRPDEEPLSYAEEDARRMRDLLVELGGVRADRAFLVTEGGVEAVRRALAEAKGRLAELGAEAETSFIFYASSHADERALHLDGTDLPFEELRKWIGELPATFELAIVDGCRTPLPSKTKGGSPVPEVALALEPSASVQGQVWMRASGPGEPAQEWARLRGSLFTSNLLSGLRGLADTNGDGHVTLAETYAFAFSRTVAQSLESAAGPQRPSFQFQMEGYGDWTFSRLEGAGVSLLFDTPHAGPIWIIDSDRNLVVELGDVGRARAKLSLRPGRYRLVRREGRFAHIAELHLLIPGERKLSALEWTRRPIKEALVKGAWEPLRPWQASLGYSVSGAYLDGMGARHSPTLSLSRQWRWGFSRLRLGASRQSLTSRSGVDIRTDELEIAGLVGKQLSFSHVILGVGLEPQLLLARQSARHPQGTAIERVFGRTEPRRLEPLWGAALVAMAELPISTRLSVQLEASAAALRVRTWDAGISAAFVPRGSAGVAWSF